MDLSKLIKIQDSANQVVDDMKVSKVSPIGEGRSLKYAEDEDGTFYVSIEDKDGVVFGMTVKNDLSVEGDQSLIDKFNETDFFPFKESNDVLRAYQQVVKSFKKKDAIDDTVIKESENSEEIIDSEVSAADIVEGSSNYLIGQITQPFTGDDNSHVEFYHKGLTEDEPEFYLSFLVNTGEYVFSVDGEEIEKGEFKTAKDVDEIFKTTETTLSDYLNKVSDAIEEPFKKGRKVLVKLPNVEEWVEGKYEEFLRENKNLVKVDGKSYMVADKDVKAAGRSVDYSSKIAKAQEQLDDINNQIDEVYSEQENDPEVLKNPDNGKAVRQYASKLNKLYKRQQELIDRIASYKKGKVSDSYKEESYTQEDLLKNKPSWAKDKALWEEAVKEATKDGGKEVRIAEPLALYKKKQVKDSDEEHFEELRKLIVSNLGEGYDAIRINSDNVGVFFDGKKVAALNMPENRIESIEILDETLKEGFDKVMKEFKKVEDSVKVVNSILRAGDTAVMKVGDSFIPLTVKHVVENKALAKDSLGHKSVYLIKDNCLVEIEDSVESFIKDSGYSDEEPLFVSDNENGYIELCDDGENGYFAVREYDSEDIVDFRPKDGKFVTKPIQGPLGDKIIEVNGSEIFETVDDIVEVLDKVSKKKIKDSIVIRFGKK